MLKVVGLSILCLLGLPLALHTILRVVRHFYKFPMPQVLADAIDNPLRRRFQPIGQMPLRLGILAGMTVLEIGPGNGKYSVSAARRLGDGGRIYTLDIEPCMIERVIQRANSQGVGNLWAGVANVFELPFKDNCFDLVYMIAVIGEIPSPVLAMREFYRVLSPAGTLAFAEILLDPDYPLARRLVQLALRAGFEEKRRAGDFFSYSLIMQKPNLSDAQPSVGVDAMDNAR